MHFLFIVYKNKQEENREKQKINITKIYKIVFFTVAVASKIALDSCGKKSPPIYLK